MCRWALPLVCKLRFLNRKIRRVRQQHHIGFLLNWTQFCVQFIYILGQIPNIFSQIINDLQTIGNFTHFFLKLHNLPAVFGHIVQNGILSENVWKSFEIAQKSTSISCTRTVRVCTKLQMAFSCGDGLDSGGSQEFRTFSAIGCSNSTETCADSAEKSFCVFFICWITIFSVFIKFSQKFCLVFAEFQHAFLHKNL